MGCHTSSNVVFFFEITKSKQCIRGKSLETLFTQNIYSIFLSYQYDFNATENFLIYNLVNVIVPYLIM